MSSKEFTPLIVDLSADTPNVYLFVVQAGNPDGHPLTGSQVEMARYAIQNVFELSGAEAKSNASVVVLDPVGEGANPQLTVSCVQSYGETVE